MMAVACIAPESVDAVLSYPADHPQRVHAAQCPRCSALLDSYRLFMNPADLEGAPHTDSAVRAIDDALARGIGVRPARQGARSSWLERLFPPALRPVYTLVVVAVVMGAALVAPRIGTRSRSSSAARSRAGRSAWSARR